MKGSRNITIKVIGIGGGGGNAVNRMVEKKLMGVEFIVVNTDAMDLRRSKALHRVQIGTQLTKGLGSAANPEIGRQAAEEDRDSLKQSLTGADIAFITCGLGGGTGTGGAPVVADILREIGALTVAVVTKPFGFEGRKRMDQAEAGLATLVGKVDTLIVIPNERLLEICERGASMIEAFRMADDLLVRAVRGISDLMTGPKDYADVGGLAYEDPNEISVGSSGLISVAFSDVRTIMAEAGGIGVFGTGTGSGDDRASKAAEEVIASPLLEGVNIRDARGILVNVTGGPDLRIHECEDVANIIEKVADEEANVIFGALTDENIVDEVRVTVIATGFDETVLIADSGRFFDGRAPIDEFKRVAGYKPIEVRPIPRLERLEKLRNVIIPILKEIEAILNRCIEEEDEIETENLFFLAEDKIRELWELRVAVADYTSDVFSLLIDFCLLFEEKPLTKRQLTFIRDTVKDLRESGLKYSFPDYEVLLKQSLEYGLDSSRLTRIDGGWETFI